MSAKHTPGPWKVQTAKFGGDRVIGPDGDVVMYGAQSRGFDETAANARLIAAAPELLEALKAFGTEFPSSGFCACKRPSEDSSKHDARCSAARAAIAKAEGSK